jgi:hypothetical protein
VKNFVIFFKILVNRKKIEEKNSELMKISRYAASFFTKVFTQSERGFEDAEIDVLHLSFGFNLRIPPQRPPRGKDAAEPFIVRDDQADKIPVMNHNRLFATNIIDSN